MKTFALLISQFLSDLFRSRASLEAEILAFRHQLVVMRRKQPRKPKLTRVDRFFWVLLSRLWSGWRRSLVLVKPETVIGCPRKGWKLYWRWRSRRRRVGRPPVAKELRDLIKNMSRANPLWGAPRIHGELLKLGIQVAQSTVSKYMVRSRKPPSQTWRTFLTNHAGDIVASDFFLAFTATFRTLYVFLLLHHERREIVHFGITEHPTAQWTAQQVTEAFPWDSAPRYLLRDRDSVYGAKFRRRVESMGIEEVLIAPRSPWQNPFIERQIGSIRRDCLDHVIILGEDHLRRILEDYLVYYHESRTHLGLGKDTPNPRPVQGPEEGPIVEIPQVGGLHHRYERRRAA